MCIRDRLSKSRQGRLQVRIGNKAIPAERVCLLLLNGEDPGTDVVFMDGDYDNLRADNLEVCKGTYFEVKPLREPENQSERIVEPPAQIDGEVVKMKNGRWLARRLNGLCIEVVGRFETETKAIEALKS